MADQYIVVHQSRDREPTEYEDLLGDALEKAFAAGVTDVDGIVASLIADAVPSPGGRPWTGDLVLSELKRLGE
ncbi:MAG: recombinase-like helix-turn-helix domain-containing protein [Zhengella sp.]|uniref:recombinase-like helix-turn-helix domain-containing protein n=1 Tax=Zhengella sp. TaxID=2282762 RepID=UPI003529B539